MNSGVERPGEHFCRSDVRSAHGREAAPVRPSSTVIVDRNGHTFVSSNGESTIIPKLGAAFDDRALRAALDTEHDSHPDGHSITVKAADAIAYQDVVHAMDLGKAAGFGAVSLEGI